MRKRRNDLVHSRGLVRTVVDWQPHPRVLGLGIATMSCGHVQSVIIGEPAKCIACRDQERRRRRIRKLLNR